MTNCADYQWYVWLKKMNIETTQYVYHEFQKRRGCRSPCKGRGGTRRENDTPLQTMLVCNLVFAIRWDKLFPFDSFFNEIQLTEKLFSLFSNSFCSDFNLEATVVKTDEVRGSKQLLTPCFLLIGKIIFSKIITS